MFAGQEESCSNEKINWIHNKKLPITVTPHETAWARHSGMYSVCNFVFWLSGTAKAS
jgi:hypothetical protein